MHLDLQREKAKAMPTVPNPQAVRSLRIWHCAYRSLDPIRAFTQLHTLVIATFPDTTLSALMALGQLRYLRILHLPKITELSPLRALSELECLSLETLPSWDTSGKVTEVDSLDPIGELRALRHLSLFGVRPKNHSLAALEHCKRLVSAQFSKYPRPEVHRFYATMRVSNASMPEPEFEIGD